MPVPIPYDPSGPQTRAQPYYVRERQTWAVDQEHLRHNQALYMVGEWAMFCLLWHMRDHTAGLVQRCPTCFLSRGKTAEAYGQSDRTNCPNCFGTTFEGGYKALIVRPTIFSDSDESEQRNARGVVNPQDLNLESTTDFRVRTGDYVFRSTGDRYFLRVPQRITVRTGFGTPHQSQAAIGYNHARASLEDRTSVAYLIPPSAQDLENILSMSDYYPIDFTPYEQIRGDLIPPWDD